MLFCSHHPNYTGLWWYISRVPVQNGISWLYIQGCQFSVIFRFFLFFFGPIRSPISGVPDQNGVSQAWYIVEIHHSGRKPSISSFSFWTFCLFLWSFSVRRHAHVDFQLFSQKSSGILVYNMLEIYHSGVEPLIYFHGEISEGDNNPGREGRACTLFNVCCYCESDETYFLCTLI